MNRTRRLQNKVTAGRLTLPAAILIAATCWMLTLFLLPDIIKGKDDFFLGGTSGKWQLPLWADRLTGFLVCGLIGYFLVVLNNVFAIIRMRASVQTSIYFLLTAAIPFLHQFCTADIAAAAFLVALFFLFRSYQKTHSTGDLFHSFLCLGIGSLFFPQLTMLGPLFWLGAYLFQSLSLHSFLASLLGWFLPYWFLLGHAFFYGEMELFYHPFRELSTFQPLHLGPFPAHTSAMLAYLFILYAISAGHCLVTGYDDKIRTRSYLHFLIVLEFCIFLYIVLQPALVVRLLPLLLPGISILAGHLFVLTHSRSSNIFFICSIIGLLLLFGYNIWMLS